jgi:hypothetical protein
MAEAIYCDVYDHWIHFLQKDRKGEWRKDAIYLDFAHKQGDTPDNHAGTCYYLEETGSILIVCDGKDIPVLAHECLHAVGFLLGRKGIVDIQSNTHEHYAYLLQWLMKKILEQKAERLCA